MKKLLMLFSAIVLVSSCAKDGEPGAQGPAGNANVKSYNYTITPGQWQTSGTSGNDYEKYIDIPVAAINQDIVDNGSVLMYWKSNGSNLQLPVTLPAGNSTINILSSSAVGTVSVEYFFSDFSSFNFTQNVDLKVMVIDGTLRIAHPEINWKDAKSIANGLHLN